MKRILFSQLLLTGELIFIYVVRDYFAWVLSYLIAWLIPALVIAIASITKGWLIRTGKTLGKKGRLSEKRADKRLESVDSDEE